MARLLGLDYGDARIGVAMSDALGWTAQALTTIARKNPVDVADSVRQIADIVRQNGVNTVVLGYPKNMNNTEGENCRKVDAFKKRLAGVLASECLNADIVLFDERLSTMRAQQIFAETDLAKSKHKQNVDKLAAAIILQGYLDAKHNLQKNEERIMNLDNTNFDENEAFDGDEIEMETIVMTDEDGNDIEYVIIDEFVNADTNYLVMIKAEDADDDEVEAVIFKQVEASEDEFVYEEIDGDEYNMLEELLKARMAEFDIDIQ